MKKEARQDELCDKVGLEQKLFDACAETAAGIGHELNNPLAIIAGHAQNLLKSETSEEKRRRLSAILEQTARAYEMIVDLRVFARPPQPVRNEVDVEKFCADWARRESKRCEENGVRLEILFELEENTSTLTTDEAMLSTILNALTKNAVEATGPGGVVKIFARNLKATFPEDGRFIEIGVEDDGPGLSAEARELLFAPYFSDRQAGRGLGVGLAKARRLADKLDVELRCEKSASFEKGVCWRLVLRG
ncbi:MAG: HAMP domain-containing histidine kinase [Thermoguttaceae bacterium]|nr:HAMP domain-containing histidine kinase [Thermoguttaceae bacterium]MBQ6826674.1 HAMP domain-containing histidine kinase [Thermoguttaceae bacterium]